MTALFELRDVTRRFGRGGTAVTAVDAISLELSAGWFVALVGPSGSGKTTLLQLMAGMDRPSSGEVLFDGQDLGRAPDRKLARLRLRAFGFVFQQFNLIPTLTALENVEAAMAPTRIRRKAARDRARSLLAEVGLQPRARHLPGKLSGGEQQRVAIARALANEPRVILADEPTGNLDTQTGAEIVDLLASLCREHGQTLIIATHDPMVARASSRIVYLRDGRIEKLTRTSVAEDPR